METQSWCAAWQAHGDTFPSALFCSPYAEGVEMLSHAVSSLWMRAELDFLGADDSHPGPRTVRCAQQTFHTRLLDGGGCQVLEFDSSRILSVTFC